jgi:CTP synthase (UTP-ammonia lyase)
VTRLAVIGDHNPRHATHRGVDHALALLPAGVVATWIASDTLGLADPMADLDGVWIAPGSPYADDEAVLDAIRTARERGIPLVGT